MAATTTILTDTTTAGAAGASLPRFVGNRTRKIAMVTFDVTSYTTGGEPLPTAASLNMQEITGVFAQLMGTSATVQFNFRWDSAGAKLISVGNVTINTQTAAAVNIGPILLIIVGY